MFGDEKNYPEATQTLAAIHREPSVREKIELRVTQAEANLKDAKRAKELLDENPALEELMNIMQRQRYL